MRAKFSLIGQKFNKLTVISEAGTTSPNNQRVWKCLCDCGNEVFVITKNLRSGNTKSCGCLKKETSKQNGVKSGKHFGSKTRLYHIWRDMKTRCYNKNHIHYDRYGGRGITVCDDWLSSFIKFKIWALSNGYNDTLTVDRIDNNKGYSPENCHCVTWKEQQRNRKSNFLINGKSLVELVEKSGLPYMTVWRRIKIYGWSVEQALTTPIRGKKNAI